MDVKNLLPERIVQRARNFTPNLYFTVPFKTKKDYNIRRAYRVKGIFKRIADSKGNVIRKVDREVIFQVYQRDGRLYPPPELITELNLTGTEYCEIILISLIAPNGEETEIYPNEMIESEIKTQLK